MPIKADSEEALQRQVADYLRIQYPDVIFHSDFGSGAKLTMSQAARQKRLNGGRRAWPDLFIADDGGKKALGLFIELKRDGTRLYKRDGSPASPHIAEQEAVGMKLMKRGYKFEFGIGFEHTKKIIDDYLGK